MCSFKGNKPIIIIDTNKENWMNRILFVNDEGIGNVVLSLPAVEAIQAQGFDVSICGKYPALDIVDSSVKAFTLDQLETQSEFDIVLLSAWAASYKAKYGIRGHTGNPEVFESAKIDGKTHEAMLHFDLASCIDGVEMPQDLSSITLPKIAMRETVIPDKPYIALCNAAAPLWDKKRWQGYAELSHLLVDDYKVIVLGGDNDRDYFNPDDYHPDVECQFDLPIQESVYLLNNAEWVVGNDCGLVHIASALGKQTIALFGATSKWKNAPLGSSLGMKVGKTQILFADIACAPCQYEAWESVCQDRECTRIVSPDAVVKSIEHKYYKLGAPMLAKPPKKPEKLACVMRVKDAIDTIEECIENASRVCDLFIILDNGSTDGTLEYLTDFQSKHPDKFQTFKYTDIGFHVGLVPHDTFQIAEVVGEFDERRDKAILDKMLKASGATWALFLDADEIVSDQITREQVEEWMCYAEYNGVKFRHMHFWEDKEHYRIDQRWKPRHNRMMWRITPESSMSTDLQVHSDVVSNLKGRILETDYVIKHYGHIDKVKNTEKAALYRKMDNPNMPNWSGRTYEHMTDESTVQLAEWTEDMPIKKRKFGNPSILIVAMHAGGDMLMLTPTLAKLKQENIYLEISVMGLGKTKEKDFKTHEYFKNNPNVHAYYDSNIDCHPLYWDFPHFNSVDLPFIQKDIDKIQEEYSTRFDKIIVVTLQSHYEQHRIERFAWACGTDLADDEKQMAVYPNDDDWDWAVDVREKVFDENNPQVFISIHRWCGNAPKSWDYKEYKELVETLAADKDKVLVLWDMGDPEPVILGENIINMRDYADELSVGRSAEMMAMCDLHIGADSMPMHLASTVKIPTISIFERTLPSTAAPTDSDMVIASSNDALRSCPTDFLKHNLHRIVRCGLGKVKAKHIYPILDKMELLSKSGYERVKTGTCQFREREIVFPEDDRNIYDPPHFKEVRVMDALNQYVIPYQSVFMDVGANAGLCSLLISNRITKGIAIEPFPDVYSMLCRNLEPINAEASVEQRGEKPLIHGIQCALSDRETVAKALSANEGMIKLNWTPRGTAISYVSEQGEYLAVDVSVKTMDTLGYQPDIIKIDVEGAELKVLQGATDILKTARVVVVELHKQHDDAVIAFMQERDFNVRYINQNHILATAKDEKVLAFPSNCLYDPCEFMTAALNEPGRLAFAQLVHDTTYWFEKFGISDKVKNVYYDEIGFKPDAIDGLIAIMRKSVDPVHVNFLYSETGEPTRYKGEMVYPLNREALDMLLTRCNELGFGAEGETDWNNVNLSDKANYPDPTTQVTRGRLLLTTDIPF